MKFIRKYIQSIWDVNRGHQDRIFRLIAGLGLVGLFVGAVAAVVSGESTENIIASIFAFLLFLGIIYLTIRYEKIQLGANVIAFLIIYLLLPMLFLTGGGIYGGNPIYFLFGVIYVCLVVEGRTKYIFIVSFLFVAADAKSIQGASKMLLTLIDDILDMSKIRSGEMDIVPFTYDVGADYEAFFASQLTRAHHIIHIAAAQSLGHGYQNALEASRTFDNVVVIDSGHLGSGLALIVLRAAECAASGLSPDAVAAEAEQMKKRVRSSFMVDSIHHLTKTGVISPRINGIFHTLLLHPVLTPKNSGVKVSSVKMGNRESARRKYISSVLHIKREIDKKVLFIGYAGLTKEELREIEAQACLLR